MTAKQKKVNIWNRTPWPVCGDSDQDKLYAAVGRALTEWERHEAALSTLFSVFVGDPMSAPARRAYGAVRTFEGRADMLRASAEAFFLGYGLPLRDLQESFEVLLKDSVQASPRRNDIAHGAVSEYRRNPLDRTTRTKSYALHPPFATFKGRNVEGVPEYCYTSVEIDFYQGEFCRLQKKAFSLTPEISVTVDALLHAARHKS
jgi:hypothetical protein